MDDYNITVLSEAKNEYSIRLINILTPLVMEGIRSIFREAWDLCAQNDENDKYLMTFQNFLTRVPKWNQDIIEGETKRIIQQSKCGYLEDLITCVHITQLKLLTSVRVSTKQKKIDVAVPRLSEFVHKVYIKCARKLYSNVYLFEASIAALQQQKNARECETICKECILGVIRDSMPLEQLLRAYIDETTEEEVVEEQVIEPASDKEKEPDKTEVEKAPMTADPEASSVASVTKVADTQSVASNQPSSIESETPVAGAPGSIEDAPVPDVHTVADAQTFSNIAAEVPSAEPALVSPLPSPKSLLRPAQEEGVPILQVETEPIPQSSPHSPATALTFSDNDKVIDYVSNDKVTDLVEEGSERTVVAPKSIDRLEEISNLRSEQRRAEDELEEEDAERIRIFDAKPNLELDTLEVEVLDRPFDAPQT